MGREICSRLGAAAKGLPTLHTAQIVPDVGSLLLRLAVGWLRGSFAVVRGFVCLGRSELLQTWAGTHQNLPDVLRTGSNYWTYQVEGAQGPRQVVTCAAAQFCWRKHASRLGYMGLSACMFAGLLFGGTSRLVTDAGRQKSSLSMASGHMPAVHCDAKGQRSPMLSGGPASGHGRFDVCTAASRCAQSLELQVCAGGLQGPSSEAARPLLQLCDT